MDKEPFSLKLLPIFPLELLANLECLSCFQGCEKELISSLFLNYLIPYPEMRSVMGHHIINTKRNSKRWQIQNVKKEHGGLLQAEDRKTFLLFFLCSDNLHDLIHSRNKLYILFLFCLTQGRGPDEQTTCLFHSMSMEGLLLFHIPPAICMQNPSGAESVLQSPKAENLQQNINR